MKALWTQDAAEFHGEFFNFPGALLSQAQAEAASPIMLGGRPRTC